MNHVYFPYQIVLSCYWSTSKYLSFILYEGLMSLKFELTRELLPLG